MNRREFIRRMVVASTLTVTGIAAVVELLARTGAPEQVYQLPTVQTQSTSQSSGQTGSSTQTQQVSMSPGYVLIGPSSSLSGRKSAYFTHPTHGSFDARERQRNVEGVQRHLHPRPLYRPVWRRVGHLLPLPRGDFQSQRWQRARRTGARAARGVRSTDCGREPLRVDCPNQRGELAAFRACCPKSGQT